MPATSRLGVGVTVVVGLVEGAVADAEDDAHDRERVGPGHVRREDPHLLGDDEGASQERKPPTICWAVSAILNRGARAMPAVPPSGAKTVAFSAFGPISARLDRTVASAPSSRTRFHRRHRSLGT